MQILELALHLVGIILAGTAALLALMLIPLTGRMKNWLFLSAALVLLAVNSITQLIVHSGAVGGRLVHVTLVDILPVIISALLLAGIAFTRALLRERKAAQEMLEKEIRSLQRSSDRGHAGVTADQFAAFQPDPGPGAKDAAERELRWLMHCDWQDAFDAMAVPVFIYDKDYRIIRANRTYAERARMAFKDIVGKPYFEIFPKLGHPIIDPLQNLQKGTAKSELRLDTGEIFLSVNFPVYDNANRFRFAVHILEDITELKQAVNGLRRTRQLLKVVTTCLRDMVQANDESEMLQTVCRVAVESGCYRLAWVGNAEHDANKSVRLLASYGYKKGVAELPYTTWSDTGAGQGLIGTAIRTGKTCLTQDMVHDPQFPCWHAYAAQNKLASAVGLPLFDGKAAWGGLVLSLDEAFAFSEEEVAVLEVLGAVVAFGVAALRIRAEHKASFMEHKQRIDELRNTFENIIAAMGMAIERRDPYAAGHQRRVGAIGMALALEMGLPEGQAYAIRLAGMVHDIGKIQVPEEILCKTGELSKDERVQLEGHPETGYDILKEIHSPWPLAQAVLQHHERLDGSGYPQGLRGGKLLLEGQILAVADTIDVLAFEQRYDHPRLGAPAALAELERNKGRLYDETIVDAALRLFREKEFVPS